MLTFCVEGDGGEQFPVAGAAPDADPIYKPPTNPHDPELEEPLEEYTEQVPQNYDMVAEGGEQEPPYQDALDDEDVKA